jgi:CRISPR/Cas system-associated exonuclease Cas4 (RecB family)
MSELLFDEELHSYSLDGKQLISVTQLLEKQKISPEYKFVNREVLQKSAEKGTFVHKEIEVYNKTGEVGFSQELQDYISYVEENELTCVASECKVYTDYFAGTFDQLLSTKDGELIITDNKTTSTLHKSAVSWQLSLYAYAYWVMTGVEVKRGQAFWFNKEGKLTVVEIPLKSREEVEALIAADKRGEIYKQPYPVEISKITELEGIKARQAELEAEIKELKEQAEDIIQDVIKAMNDKNCDTFESENATKFTIVKSRNPDKFDDKRFMKDHKDLYDEYVIKGSARKDQLKITLRKEN